MVISLWDMKHIISIFIVILLLSVSVLAIETKIIEKREMIESQYGLLGHIGLGDRVYKVTYNDGSVELQYERGTKVFGAFIWSVPTSIDLNVGQTLTFPYNIRGTSCNFNIGRTHVITVQYGSDSAVIKADSFPGIACNADNWKTLTLTTSQFSRFNQAGQSGTIKLVETIPNPGSYNGVVRGDTVYFTVNIIAPTPTATPTPTPTPTPSTGKIVISSTPSGATVLIDNSFKGVTPLTIDLPQKTTPYNIELRQNGYNNFIQGVVVTNGITSSVIGTMTIATTSPTPIIPSCPLFSPPYCPNGQLVGQGVDDRGCQKPSICVTPTPTSTPTPTPTPSTFYVAEPPQGYTIEGCWNAAVEKPGYLKPCDMNTWDGNITIVPEETPAPIVTGTPTSETMQLPQVPQQVPIVQPTQSKPCPEGYNDEGNKCVRYLYNKETIPITPGFEAIYPIIGLLFVAWRINRNENKKL